MSSLLARPLMQGKLLPKTMIQRVISIVPVTTLHHKRAFNSPIYCGGYAIMMLGVVGNNLSVSITGFCTTLIGIYTPEK